ncbi:MAG: hypothetical protein OEU26_18095, partial [Candidatus Tectomicrobia bacterium]|nr:hypothetical protein [Candidatus Tectomicrobia bacterium]
MSAVFTHNLKADMAKPPCNKSRTVGQKAPLTRHQVCTTRHLIAASGNPCGLALFNTAIDTMLRTSDLLALNVENVIDHAGAPPRRFSTNRPASWWCVRSCSGR